MLSIFVVHWNSLEPHVFYSYIPWQAGGGVKWNGEKIFLFLC